MELENALLRDFAKITNDNSGNNDNITAYGTVNSFYTNADGSKTGFVTMDGAEELNQIPATFAMDAEAGDRVKVEFKNHTATVTGNITSPASARTATSYMQLTEEGLAVGEVEDGKMSKAHTLMSSDSYKIIDNDGNVVAEFSASLLRLGALDTSKIQLCNDSGEIKMNNAVLSITSNNAVGLTTANTADSKSTIYSELVSYSNSDSASATTPTPEAALQVYQKNNTTGSIDKTSSIIVSLDDGVHVTVPSGKFLSVSIGSADAKEVLTTDTLIRRGTSKATFTESVVSSDGTTTTIVKGIAAGATLEAYFTVDLPTGYMLGGINEIRTNHSKVCYLTQFGTDVTTNKIHAKFRNAGSSDLASLYVAIEWFAFKNTTVGTVEGDGTVQWTTG